MFDAAPPPKLWTPPKPAIIRAVEMPRSPTEARGIGYEAMFGQFVRKKRGGAAAKVLTFIGAQATSSNLTTYSFDFDIGPPADDLKIIVGAWGSNGPRTFNSGAVDGNALALVSDGVTTATQAGGNNSTILAIADCSASDGGEVTVSVTWSAGYNRGVIAVWRVTGLSSTTAVDVGSSTGDPASDTLNTVAGGFMIAMAGCNAGFTGNAGGTWSGTGVAERFDIEAEATTGATGADAPTTGAAITPSCDYTGSNTNRAMVAVTF